MTASCPDCSQGLMVYSANKRAAYMCCPSGHRWKRQDGEWLAVKVRAQEILPAAIAQRRKGYNEIHAREPVPLEKKVRVPVPPCPDCGGKMRDYNATKKRPSTPGWRQYQCGDCKERWERPMHTEAVSRVAAKVSKVKQARQKQEKAAKVRPPIDAPVTKRVLSNASRLDDLREARRIKEDLW